MAYHTVGETIGKLTKEISYYLQCTFCGDTANEDELQVTRGYCPECNNNKFDEVKDERR